MQVFHNTNSLIQALVAEKAAGKTIGFVPTMGALHEGHVALVRKAFEQADKVVVSIFVNPTQFNNPTDLDKYPRMLDEDVELLRTVGDVFIFAPTIGQIYPENDHFDPIDLEGIDTVLEGQFRPGHFQGVVHVVRNLFQIVQPEKAFFGLKDFQQVAIIRMMTKKLNLPVEIIACETERDPDGLALSSRNLRLSDSEKEEALIIFKTLEYLKSIKSLCTPAQAREKAIEFFHQSKLKLEYLEIVDGENLKPLDSEWKSNSTCCIAAFCGAVRLIDNMQL